MNQNNNTPPPIDDPLGGLLSKEMSKMTTEELLAHSQTLRELATSTPAVKKIVDASRKEKAPTKENDLLDKYTNL